jgi:hypothetical protein
MPRQILPPTVKAVHSYLRHHADETGTVSASSSQISAAVGCCRLSARKALQRLQQLGIVEIVPSSGPGGQTLANTLRLTNAEG